MEYIKLEWRELLRLARAGQRELRGPDGKAIWMLWVDPNKTVFVSDPVLLEHIDTARHHSDPFVLIGAQHTGKNVFLNLVATSSAIPCEDQNVAGEPKAEIERFFGKGGVVDRHRSALLHFDFMEGAVRWDAFVEKLRKLAEDRELDRTDGEVVKCEGIRVVLGANYDLEPILPAKPSVIRHLYVKLSGYQRAITRRLGEQTERIPIILGEMLAALVIRGEIDEQQAENVERIPASSVDQLRQYSVPDEFAGLLKVVRVAARQGGWGRAIEEAHPAGVNGETPEERVRIIKKLPQ